MTNHKIEFGFRTIFAVIVKARKNNSITEEGFVETKADYKNGQQGGATLFCAYSNERRLQISNWFSPQMSLGTPSQKGGEWNRTPRALCTERTMSVCLPYKSPFGSAAEIFGKNSWRFTLCQIFFQERWQWIEVNATTFKVAHLSEKTPEMNGQMGEKSSAKFVSAKRTIPPQRIGSCFRRTSNCN